jgi:hypothetical protein
MYLVPMKSAIVHFEPGCNFQMCQCCFYYFADHPSCLDYTKDHAAHVMETGTWQCTDCKACQVCQGQCSEVCKMDG